MDTEPDKKVQVQIEVGHSATCRETTTAEGYTHDWSIFVRGAKGADISHFVEKVVFILHESFPKPKRSLTKPPYKIEERGYGSFNLPVEIHFRNKEVPRKHKLDYDLFLQLVGMPPVNNTKVEALTFLNPAAEFEQKLLKGGAVILGKDNQVFSPTNRADAGASPSNSLSPNSSHNKRPLTPQAGTKSGKIKEPPTPVRTSPSNSTNGGTKRSISPNDQSHTSSVQAAASAGTSSAAVKVKKKKLDKQGNEKIDSPSSAASKPTKDSTAAQSSVNTPSPASKSKSKDKKEKSSKDKRKTSAEASPMDTSPASASFSTSSLSSGTKLKSELKSELKFVKKDKKDKKFAEKRLLSPEKSDTLPGDQQKAAPDSGPPPPKLQKITMKRTASDAWTNKSKSESTDSDARAQGFLRELAEDDSDSEDMSDAEPGSKAAPSAAGQKRTPETLQEGQPDLSSTNKPLKKNKSPKVTTPNSVNKNSSSKTDTNKSKPSQLISQQPSTLPSASVKKTSVKEQISSTPPASNGVARPDLIELYRRISQVDDNDTLQEIVDIVERSGLFEITSTTFDFDLQYLDSETINLLQRYFIENP